MELYIHVVKSKYIIMYFQQFKNVSSIKKVTLFVIIVPFHIVLFVKSALHVEKHIINNYTK